MAVPGSVEGYGLSPGEIEDFREMVWRFSRASRRDFPWRNTEDPYCILVSEVMLQQTGVERVGVSYPAFIETFPGFSALAAASLSEVLRAWKGLGYNRRAYYLHQAARIVQNEHGGSLPRDERALVTLPGVGRATAAAIRAFAFNEPSVFIETNIRRTFLFWFFPEGKGISDRTILPLVAATLDQKDPREWYYALMDLGHHLRCIIPDPNTRSAHYHRQSPFPGSDREIRGKIIGLLLSRSPMDQADLLAAIHADPGRVLCACSRLEEEGIVTREGGRFRIT
ncbi:MAG: A/G-specific adenine glycosylase [Methanolinea sp.]|nr:A/G-specific adenine glycosylase [Methanolinea sp.]